MSFGTPKPCKYCQSDRHLSWQCFQKPRRSLRPVSEKTLQRGQATKRLWFEFNPPSPRGTWQCYLQISPSCPKVLTKSTVLLEHVKGRARHPESKYDVDNLRPACDACNQRKGSLDIEDLVAEFPHLKKYL